MSKSLYYAERLIRFKRQLKCMQKNTKELTRTMHKFLRTFKCVYDAKKKTKRQVKSKRQQQHQRMHNFNRTLIRRVCIL